MPSGELLEKVTRVLTDEEKALLDQDWVGRNGTKRKLEVGAIPPLRSIALILKLCSLLWDVKS